ncbi:mediator of RNA polymerase II transcription subunit 15a-like [Carex rostrata]
MGSNSNVGQSGAGVGSESNANLDWRSLLPLDTRQRIVNSLMDTLKRHLPVPVPEGINELQKIAVRFEEKIYNASTSQPDYLRKISLKMLSMGNKTQPGLNPSLPNQNPMDPGEGMTSQQPSLNPGQSLGMPQVMNQPPASRQQQPLLQGLHNMPTAVPGGPSGPNWFPPYENVFKQETATAATGHATKAAAAGGSGMMSAAPTAGLQQSLLNSVQQKPMGQGGSFQQQPLMRQQPQPTMQNPTMPMQWTNNVTDLQQQRLQMQQNQLQQSQMQQNQLQSNQMQQKHVLYQQMMLGQQQNQLLGSRGAGNMNNMQQRHMQMQRQADLLQQQQRQQSQQRQHLLSQLQSQQQQPSMMQQRGMQMPQQQMQGSPALLQTQNSNAIDPQRQQQQQQPQQQQRVLQDVASSHASMDSTAQTGHPGDWQDEIYQRLKYLKDTYLAELREIHQKLSIKISQMDSIVPPNAKGGEQIERMKHFKMVLERMMTVLQLGKDKMQIGLKDKLSLYEKQILSILQNHKKAPQQQPQAGAPSDQPHFPGLQQSQPSLQSQQLPQQQQPQQMNPPQMVGSRAAIGSSNMSHTVTVAGMQTNMSSAQVLKPQQQHQEQQIQPQQQMMQHRVIQQQLNTSAMPQSNNIGVPNAMQQGIQNTLQSDQLRASGAGSSLQNTMKTRKCKICKDCVHKRRNSN